LTVERKSAMNTASSGCSSAVERQLPNATYTTLAIGSDSDNHSANAEKSPVSRSVKKALQRTARRDGEPSQTADQTDGRAPPRKIEGRERTESVIYRGMIKRCDNPRTKDFRFYGGRGIRVCDRWRGPLGWRHFFSDMGPRPSSGHCLDRIDSNGNYEPGNCRWATVVDQQRNRRSNRLLTINGVTKCASAWAEEAGLARQHLISRLNAGWDPTVAVSTPQGVSKEEAHRAA
jgi:hypothetical protein